MIFRVGVIAVLVFALAAPLAATTADARKKKYRTKPYPSSPVVRRTPPADFVPPKGVQLNTKPNPAMVMPRQGTCGAPPCAGGASSLGTRDIRNYQPRDIRSIQPRTNYQSPYAR